MSLCRKLITGLFVVTLGGCFLSATRDDAASTTLTSAQMRAAKVSPMLPIVVLRTAHDELGLETADRAGVSMILELAESDAATLNRARAGLLEVLAQDVDAGRVDEVRLSLFLQQIEWAAGQVAPRMESALEQLHELLPPAKRGELAARVEQKLSSWAPTWAATGDHVWVTDWPHRKAELTPDLTRTSRAWAEKTAADVRNTLPRLTPAQRRRLATSLREGEP